jgi:hypothetical protein
VASRRDRIILFPRYTTLAGTGDFTTVPIDVTSYESGDVAAWMGEVVGPTTPGVVAAFFEESTDQEGWTTCGGTGTLALVSGQEAELAPVLRKPWMRFRINVASGVGGSPPVLTVYAVGYLQGRKGAGP